MHSTCLLLLLIILPAKDNLRLLLNHLSIIFHAVMFAVNRSVIHGEITYLFPGSVYELTRITFYAFYNQIAVLQIVG